MEHKSVRRSSKNAPDKELLITSVHAHTTHNQTAR